MHIYYTIYKTTNKVNGKFYIGSHKTKDLNDDYMGSGKYLKHSIEKHGLDNFNKEILFIYDTPEEMYAKEAEIVSEDFLAEENTYNLKIGGLGGWDHIINDPKYDKYRAVDHMTYMSACGLDARQQTLTELRKNPDWVSKYSKSVSNGLSEYYNNGGSGSFSGKKHTNETKRKIGEANSLHQKGPNNSQYGTMWVTDGIVNKKINKLDPVPNGFRKGRVIRK